MNWSELEALAVGEAVTAGRLAALANEACGWLIGPATDLGELDVHTASLELSLAAELFDGDAGYALSGPPDSKADLRGLALLVSAIARAASARCAATVAEMDAAVLLASAARRLDAVGV